MRLPPHIPAALLLAATVAACERPDHPAESSPEYAEAVAAFYRGVAAAQVGETSLAATAFQRVTELMPREPAGWADLGLIALQRNELDQAAAALAEARVLAPEHGAVAVMWAVVAREAGRLEEAIEQLRQAVRAEPGNLEAAILLAQLVEEADRVAGVPEAAALVDGVLAAAPGNLVALMERARLATTSEDLETLGQALDAIAARAGDASPAVGAELNAVRAAAEAGDFGRAATQIAFLRTELAVLPAFQDDEEAVLLSPTRGDLLLTSFISAPAPTARAAAADTSLAFVAETLIVTDEPITWARAVWLNDDAPLTLIAGGAESLWISPQPNVADAVPFPGGAAAGPVPSAGVATLDYDYDFRMDLALAGPGGLRLLRQDDAGSFTDVTRGSLPPAVTRAAYAGAWAADLDMEGDVDLVLAETDGPALALRNLGDGRFEPYRAFDDVNRARAFVWADLDADGDPDAAFLDADGALHLRMNRRSQTPPFISHPPPDTLAALLAVTAADLDQDAVLDLIALGADGALATLTVREDGTDLSPMGRWQDLAAPAGSTGRLFAADLDNNGRLDLVAVSSAGTRAWLHTDAGLYDLPPIDLPVTGIRDVTGEGRLDLIAVAADGRSHLLANQGNADFFSATVRPRAAQVTGDRRINSFGIGGEIEVRAGLLYQKNVIDGPAVHFGLGEQPLVDVARILWPNGSVQAEFNLAATNETILTRQRLKGSCPWVFTFNGETMDFVTDFIWRSALGLRINAQGEAAVIHGEDWIKIRGDQLTPRDGFYDIRITAELWETHFFDHVSLLVVDHPESTEVFVDERFTVPAPEPAVHAMRPVRTVAQAWDERGRDVTDAIRERDGRHLDTFVLGPYQGIAEEHWVEIAFGDDLPADGPLWLVASGWVYPTDASINVASSQGTHPPPFGLQLDVPDGRGGWTTARPDLGFPAGKTKTILIDLRDVFQPGAPRRARLRTNMEIYWDHIGWSEARPDAPVTTQRLLPATAELRYRGFSEVSQARRSTPETPDYERLATTVPLWRDLVGFHTRFGDVRPLNEAVDDRYTIMNAGDELVLLFPEHPAPPDGWTRDFVLIGDGWVKDGDLNTGFSTTVLPLPYHGMTDYAVAPTRLEDDPGYRLHPDDWRTFHTRYVTPRAFHRALVSQPR